MIKSTTHRLRLTFTKDQSEYIKHRLPLKYSLQAVRNKQQRFDEDMALQEIRYFEKGGQYGDDIMQIEEPLKYQEESEFWAGDDEDATSSGNSIELEEVLEQALICKIEDDIQRIQEEGVEESEYQPQKVLMEEEFEQSSGLQATEKQSKQSNIKQKAQEIKLPEIIGNLNLVPAPPHLIPYMENKIPRKKRQPRKQKPKSSAKPQLKPVQPEPVLQTSSQTVAQPFPIPHPVICPAKALTTQQKHYLFILNQTSQNSYHNLFSKPLSPAQLEYLGYNLIEQKAMSLPIIESNILANTYSHLQQLHRDLLLVWLNTYCFKPTVCPSKQQSDKNQLKSYLFNNNLEEMDKKLSTKPSKFSKEDRRELCEQIRLLSHSDLVGLWDVVTGNSFNGFEIVFDLETMEDAKFGEVKNFVENCYNRPEENAKQRRQD